MGFLIVCSIIGIIVGLSISDEENIGVAISWWLALNIIAYYVYSNWDTIFV